MLKILKWFLGTVFVLAALLLAGSLLLSSDFTVSRNVLIAAPADKIYPFVADPRNWKQWSVWNQRDPSMAITYDGPPSGNGAKWTWKSKSEGDGAMTFKDAEPGRKLGYDLYFPDFGTTSTGALTFTSEGQGTRVAWTMKGNMGSNPLFRWVALFADKMVGKDFEEGLANLKALVERRAP